MKIHFGIVLFCVLSSSLVFSHQREHSAHVHGQGKISIAFDQTSGSIDMEVPAEVLFGFEHEAKTEKDQKTQSEALAKLESSMTDMVRFDESLGCVTKKKNIEVKIEKQEEKKGKHVHGQHSDVDAEFEVTCQKSPLNSKLIINIQKYFPRLKKTEVQVLLGNIQKKIQATQNGTTLELK